MVKKSIDGKKRRRSNEGESPKSRSGGKGGKLRRGKELNEEERRKLLDEGILEAKMELEKEKAEIMSLIPTEYKDMFGQIGFTKWNKNLLPVLILSPYDVPPNVRTQWIGMFHNLKKQDRLANLTYLIFWYGYGTCDATNRYSFIQKQNFTPYEEGVKKGFDKLPPGVQKKLDNKKSLASDTNIVRAFEEMREDLEKDPTERKRGVEDFKEAYEELTLADVDEIIIESGDEVDESDDADSKGKKINSKKKTTSSKKSHPLEQGRGQVEEDKHRDDEALDIKTSNHGDDENESRISQNGNDGDFPESERKKRRQSASSDKSKQKKKKKKGASKDDHELHIDVDQALTRVENPAERDISAVTVKDRGDKASTEDLTESSVGSMVRKKSTTTRKLDRSRSKRRTQSQNDDKACDDGVLSDNEELNGQTRASRQDENESANPASDDEEDSSTSWQSNGDEKVRGKEKFKPKSNAVTKKKKLPEKKKIPSAKVAIKIEREAFRKCEENYAELLNSWSRAIEAKHSENVTAVLKEVSKSVEAFPPTFIEAYGVANLLRKTKLLLSPSDIEFFHDLRSAFRVSYEAKKRALPQGFVLNKSDVATRSESLDTEAKITAGGGHDRQAKSAPSDKETQDSSESPDLLISPLGVSTKVSGDVALPKHAVSVQSSALAKKEAGGTICVQSSSTGKSKKSFSLTSFMSQGTKETVVVERAAASVSKATVTKSVEMPSWMTDARFEPDESLADYRLLALDFLLEMASLFPPEKTNHYVMARSIEVSLYNQLCSDVVDEGAIDRYWNKVHTIVAAVCGKRSPGGLFQSLMSGEFKDAKDLINLNDAVFVDSYEGRHVRIEYQH